MNTEDDQMLIDSLQEYEENILLLDVFDMIQRRNINDNSIIAFNDNENDTEMVQALTDFQNTQRLNRRIRRSQIRDENNAIDHEQMQIDVAIEEAIEEEPQQQQVGGALAYRKIRDFKRVRSQRFGLQERNIEYESAVDEHASYDTMIDSLLDFVDNIVNTEIHPLGPNVRVRLIINHDSFDGSINFNYLFADQITTDLIWNEFEKTSQSRKARFGDIVPNQKLYITIQTIDMIAGGANPSPIIKKKKKITSESQI